MKNTLIFALLLTNVAFAQEEFSFQLYFEDALGNKDTITVGYDDNATNGIDATFGEVNIIAQPWDNNFEVRVTDKMPSILYQNPTLETFRTKKQIIKKHCGESWAAWAPIYIDVKVTQFPFTISWDYNTFQNQNECIIGTTMLNVSSTLWFDLGYWGGKMIYGTEMSFSNIPENNIFMHYDDEDDKTIFPFWLRFGDSTLLTLTDNSMHSTIFSVYPNPFKNEFTITSDLPFSEVKLHNSIGQKILFEQQESVIFLDKNLNNGVYILSFEIAGMRQYRRIIKE